MLGLIGKKIGMTQIFDSDGRVIPVTVLKAGPCRVVSKRSVEDHGYEALQLGYEEIKEKNCPRPVAGHFKKNGSPLYRYLREFRPSYGQDIDAYEVGTELKVDMFDLSDTVTVTANSKGRGFAVGPAPSASVPHPLAFLKALNCPVRWAMSASAFAI